jgi:hypothetical protein
VLTAYAKRVLITTILGILVGLVCWYSGTYVGIQFTNEMILGTILDRMLIGFVIGISGWQINYLLHGALIGAIVSWPASIYGGAYGFNALMWFGIAYGIIIELIATKLLNAPMKTKKK